jgi:DNA-binding CsgD family transcriptional regulator
MMPKTNSPPISAPKPAPSVISLKELTVKQREVWKMRYHYNWRMKRIALRMGVTVDAVSKILRRAHAKAGLPRRAYIRIIPTQPRSVHPVSLSRVFEGTI